MLGKIDRVTHNIRFAVAVVDLLELYFRNRLQQRMTLYSSTGLSQMPLIDVNLGVVNNPRRSLIENAELIDKLMICTFIASLIISPLILLYFAKLYCCTTRQLATSQIDKVGKISAINCVGKKKRKLMEDYFNIVENENELLSRSAASSVDHGYLAEYIKCENVKQQATSQEV
jgi:hypothetical protein